MKIPHPIDVHVGARLRMRRVSVGVSQERLGAALGVTFQQVQKYEKGSNRVSASRLQQIGGVLNVSAAYFFVGAPDVQAPALGSVEKEDLTDMFAFLSTPEGAQLASAFSRIADARLRRQILDLVEGLVNAKV